ncbi:MAG: polysaccharide biosynthesis C-terminal domain-containing protein [Chlorobium sp.]|nr:polysaccharide biosynthesis C-terminal domain-containing protein [Chlorobium sp.]
MKEDHLFSFEVNRKTIGKSAASSVLVQLLSKLKGLISMPILTLLMAPAEMGTFNLILVTSSVLTPLVTLNLTDGVGVLFAQEKNINTISKMYNSVLNVIFILTVSYCFISIFYYIFFAGQDSNILWISLLLLSNIVYKLPIFLLATYQKTEIILKNSFIKDITGTILTILLVYIGYSYKGMVFSMIFFNLVCSIQLYNKIFSNISYSCQIDTTILKQFLKMALPLLPVFFFSWIVQSSDSYFLAYFSGKEAVGKYSVIYGINSMILSITFALNFFWFPMSGRLWVESRDRYMKVFTVVFAGMLTVLLTVVCLFEFNSKALMMMFVRQLAYQDAYIIMGIIAFAFSMQVMITLLTAPLYSNRNTKAIFSAYLVGGIVNTILNITLIPKSGIVGAAVSTAIAYLVIVVVMGILNYRLARFSFIDSRLKYIIPVYIVIWGLLWVVRGYLSIPEIIITDFIFVTLVALLIYKQGLRSDEREYISTLIKNFHMKQE